MAGRRPSRAALLAELSGGARRSTGELASRLGTSPSAVSLKLIELEQLGVVERVTLSAPARLLWAVPSRVGAGKEAS